MGCAILVATSIKNTVHIETIQNLLQIDVMMSNWHKRYITYIFTLTFYQRGIFFWRCKLASYYDHTFKMIQLYQQDFFINNSMIDSQSRLLVKQKT